MTLGVGSELLINVSWSAPVEALPPLGAHRLWLDAGKARAAVLEAGNGTSMFRYRYLLRLNTCGRSRKEIRCAAQVHGRAGGPGDAHGLDSVRGVLRRGR